MAVRLQSAGAAEVCGLRTQIRSNCWIRGLTANGFFLFRGRDVAIAMNSVKILHAVRLAITAIAELLVIIMQSSLLEWIAPINCHPSPLSPNIPVALLIIHY